MGNYIRSLGHYKTLQTYINSNRWEVICYYIIYRISVYFCHYLLGSFCYLTIF